MLEDGREPVIKRFWSLNYQPKLAGSDEQLLDELEAKVEESLRLHLVSDVPVGALLSGGLDSSLLVAMLVKRIGVKDLNTFTVGLPHQRFDEAPRRARLPGCSGRTITSGACRHPSWDCSGSHLSSG